MSHTILALIYTISNAPIPNSLICAAILLVWEEYSSSVSTYMQWQ